MKQLFPVFLVLLSTLIGETGYPAFDVFTSSSQLALGGAGFLNPSPISSKLNPSVADTSRYFSTSIIRYQAGITSQSAGMSLPWKDGIGTFSLRHIAYGTFDGYDENFNSSGAYQSGDTWIHSGFSKQFKFLPVRVGTSLQYFSSFLKDHQVKALLFSFGGELFIHRFQGTFGVSLHHVGKTFSRDQFAEGAIVSKTVISGAKKLAHLPLTLFLDTVLSPSEDEPETFLGGIFNLKNNVQIRWGTSTRKVDHNTKQDFFRSVIGATGFGIGYQAGVTTIHYGAFIFGTGAMIHGIEIGIGL